MRWTGFLRGYHAKPEHDAEPCGSELARDGAGTFNIYVDG